jgi:hypothetical protein
MKNPFVLTNVHLADATDPASCLDEIFDLKTFKNRNLPGKLLSASRKSKSLRLLRTILITIIFALIMVQRNDDSSAKNSYNGSGTPVNDLIFNAKDFQ